MRVSLFRSLCFLVLYSVFVMNMLLVPAVEATALLNLGRQLGLIQQAPANNNAVNAANVPANGNPAPTASTSTAAAPSATLSAPEPSATSTSTSTSTATSTSTSSAATTTPTSTTTPTNVSQPSNSVADSGSPLGEYEPFVIAAACVVGVAILLALFIIFRCRHSAGHDEDPEASVIPPYGSNAVGDKARSSKRSSANSRRLSTASNGSGRGIYNLERTGAVSSTENPLYQAPAKARYSTDNPLYEKPT